MSTNAIHCCIIFSTSKESALNKLEQIFECRSVDKRRIRANAIEYVSGNEKWVWLDPSRPGTTRGYRAHKAFVDADCTIRQLREVIQPICYLHCELFEFY